MYERMLDKKIKPNPDEIRNYIGKESDAYLDKMEKLLRKTYDLNKELRFPFGNKYGWGYKFSHKTKHLFYLFFEKGSITATMQIAKRRYTDDLINRLSKQGKNLWENRYPCGNGGGWVHLRISDNVDFDDFLVFLQMKTGKRIS